MEISSRFFLLFFLFLHRLSTYNSSLLANISCTRASNERREIKRIKGSDKSVECWNTCSTTPKKSEGRKKKEEKYFKMLFISFSTSSVFFSHLSHSIFSQLLHLMKNDHINYYDSTFLLIKIFFYLFLSVSHRRCFASIC